MLAGLRQRVRDDSLPEPVWPDREGPQVLALARQDSESRTVCLILDATTANITMFAVAAYAADREAHVREIEQFGGNLPEESYGRRNREAIAVRETRVAGRLRAVQQAYRAAVEYDTTHRPPEPTRALRSPDRQLGRKIDLEAEP